MPIPNKLLLIRDPARALRMEASRSVKRDEAMLEYFAPKYIEVKRKGGEFVRTERPLLYNYVFIRSTEAEIYRRHNAFGASSA